MSYLLLKVVHITAVIVWVGGSIALAVAALALAQRTPIPVDQLVLVRRCWITVTSPAMLVVWAIGLALATMSGAFSSPWMQAKLVLVLVISGWHGAFRGYLRRLAAGTGTGSLVGWRASIILIGGATLLVVSAVVLKIGGA